MRQVCRDLPGWKMANIVEGGETPELSHAELEDIGYTIAAYPLTLMAAAMQAMVRTLAKLGTDEDRRPDLMDFAELRRRIGFDAYYALSSRYDSSKRDNGPSPGMN